MTPPSPALALSSRTVAEERRTLERKRTLKKGSIVFLEGNSGLDCVVLDFTEKGARLRPTDILCCPPQFQLLGPDRQLRLCEVVWRNSDALGVKFL